MDVTQCVRNALENVCIHRIIVVVNDNVVTGLAGALQATLALQIKIEECAVRIIDVLINN